MSMPKKAGSKPKVCVVSTTPLAIHFFLKPHLLELSRFADISLAFNPKNDSYTPALDLPTRIVPIRIARHISPVTDLTTLVQLYKFFSKEKPDLVWAVTPKGGLLGMLAARFAGIKHRVFIFQGEVWASKSGILRLVLRLTDKLCVACATRLLAVSFLEKSFLEREKIVSQEHIEVLGKGSIGGVDIKRYKPDIEVRNAVRTELGIPYNAVVALFVGRLTKDKGILELVQAYREVSRLNNNVWLLIVGPDEQKLTPCLTNLLEEATVKCRILGFAASPECYMAAADFFCLPSYREGFSVAVIEAAAVGIPTIGSHIPGIADTIEDGKTGLLVEPKNITELQAAMLRLVEDAPLRHQLGRAARQNVLENFKSSEVVGRYVDLFRSLLTDTRHTQGGHIE
jgi:glycosyltransferase involved in cell wall biosynthesis